MSHQRNKNTDTKPLSHAPYSAAQPEVKNRDAEICSLQRSASRARLFSCMASIDAAYHDQFQREWEAIEGHRYLFDDFLS